MNHTITPLKVIGIVLAAGESRRMGVPKLLLPTNGGSLLKNAVWTLAELIPTIVVTGAYPVETKAHLGETQDLLTDIGLAPVQFAHNPDWSKGMAGSIATGIRAALPLNPAGFFIIVADQPGFGLELTDDYFEAFTQNPARIIATWYPEGPGVPAIFPARLQDQLLARDGKAGAKRLIRDSPEDVIVVRAGMPPFIDIDTPEDYERLTGRKPGE